MIFELDRYDKSLHRLPQAAPESPYQAASRQDIEKMSLLYWAEHCVECAAPSCYQTCDLYHAREDLRCRRFTFGAHKNTNFPSVHSHGVEISFKKWAKMEAYGNLRLFPTPVALLAEKALEWVAPAANALGRFVAKITGRNRPKALTHIILETLARWLAENSPAKTSLCTFLLEIHNPGDDIVRMHLSFAAIPTDGENKNALVQLSQGLTTTIVCPPGYSRHEIEPGLLRGMVDSAVPFVIRLIPEADADARLVFLSANFVKFASHVQHSERKQVKCVVFDLDNTLWKGVLVEGDEVTLQPEMTGLLKHLDERGILLSIASKNDHATALKKLRKLGVSEYFLYPQINWSPKSQSVKSIAERLNIGIDAIAFVDDNSFELDEVAAACPEVLCVNAADTASLFSDPRFCGSSTHDARRRRQLYRDAEAREIAQESFGADSTAFLASCEIKLEISSYFPEDSERVAELVQRTNQLNFSGRKYTRPDLEEVLSNPTLDKFVLKSSDRYGAHGTIGFCIVERTASDILIRDFMLSCRVQGKLLEKAFFQHLLRQHYPGPVNALWIDFRKTARNVPAQQVLQTMGFRPGDPKSKEFSEGMNLTSFELLQCEIIHVNCFCHAPQPATLQPALSSTV